MIALARVEGRLLRDGDQGEWERVGRQLRLLHGVTPPDGLPHFLQHGDSWCDFVCWWAGHEADAAGRRGLLGPSDAARLRDRLVESFVAMSEPEHRFIHGDCQSDRFLLADEPSSASSTSATPGPGTRCGTSPCSRRTARTS